MSDQISDLSEWWPELLSEIQSENPLAEKYVTAAKVQDPWGEEGYQKIYTALIPPELIDDVLKLSGSVVKTKMNRNLRGISLQ